MPGERVLFVCGLAQEAALAQGPGVETLISGGDAGALAAALDRLDPRGLRCVVSFGLAGGLDPDLPAGARVVPGSVVDDAGRFDTDADLAAALRVAARASGGVVAGVDVALTSAAEKTACRQRGQAVAVDMESHRAGRFAARHSLPFVVLRAISDPADAALPPLARVALRPDGKLAPGPIVRSLLAHPAQIAQLPRLARDSRRAFEALADMRRKAARLLGLV